MEKQLFRKKSLDGISSPEQLQDYMKVTNPGVWMILTAVILLLAGFLFCSVVGKVELSTSVEWKVENGVAYCRVLQDGADKISQGMPARVKELKTTVSKVVDGGGSYIGIYADAVLPDGTYTGVIVTDTVSPISFLWNK